ncbi:MAG TPA: S41 family peptidase [Clostridia bacterium]|nr:S41 family peptidase [Clostridia bacterium]
MKKFLSIILTFVIVISLLFGLPIRVLAQPSTPLQTDEELYNDLADIGSIMKYIIDNYIGDVTYQQLKEAALKGIFSSLDEYSTYFTKGEFGDFTRGTSGVFSGTGMVLTEKNGQIIVDSVIESSPAEKAGVKSGYIIKAVDGKSVEGMKINEVVNKIIGEEGTKVKVTFDIGGTLKEIELTRQIIYVNPVSYKITDEIGYIKITEFNENTTSNMAKALVYMDKNNVNKIVLDLRNNPGGLLTEAVSVANFFIPHGVVVTVERKNGEKDEYYSYLSQPKYKLAVLINNGTASASEIVAGAIQDTKVGLLIGENSFGKGTVQSVVPLPEGDGFKLTIARYKLPSGRYIDKNGLTPDIIVVNTTYSVDLKFTKELKIGSRGTEVKLLQYQLNLLKFNAGIEDGIFGPKTERAVEELQKQTGLPVTGIFDKNTYDAMVKMLQELNAKDSQLEKAIEVLKGM